MRHIFVFGSNRPGIHGRGAALGAKLHWGAVQGQGEGLQGDSYGIVTKLTPRKPLSLWVIEANVKAFIQFASLHPEMIFLVTKVGCGLAGYKDEDIAPFFKGAPDNCRLHSDWFLILGMGQKYYSGQIDWMDYFDRHK